jgi:hypothetical protein
MNRQPQNQPTSIPTLIAACWLALSGCNAHAETGTAEQWFDSPVHAVVAATDQYNPISIREDREFMGAVLRRGNHYTFTVGAGEAGQDRITVRISIPAGTDVIAFWHTHGARHHRHRYFSNVDTDLVESSRKPFYLADYTGVLKVMKPGGRKLSKSQARHLGLPPRAGFARGDVVHDVIGAPVRIATR